VTENSPRAGIKFAALVCQAVPWIVPDSRHTFFAMSSYSAMQVNRLAARTSEFRANSTHSPQPVYDSTHQYSDRNGFFAHLVLLKERFINCLSTQYSKVLGNWLFASVKWGNSTSGEKAVRKWAYHTSQRPLAAFINVPWLKTCAVQAPLACMCITF
jgi:hypothetical protein